MSESLAEDPSKAVTPEGVAASAAPNHGHVNKPVSVSAARAKKPADRTAAERAAVRSAAAKKAAATRAANAAKAAAHAHSGEPARQGSAQDAVPAAHTHGKPHRASAHKTGASKPPAAKKASSSKASGAKPKPLAEKSAARAGAPTRGASAKASTVAPPSKASRPSSAAELVATPPVTASRKPSNEPRGADTGEIEVETIERPGRVNVTTSSVVPPRVKRQSAASIYASLSAPLAPSAPPVTEEPASEQEAVDEQTPERPAKELPTAEDVASGEAQRSSEIDESTTPRRAITRTVGAEVLEITGLVKRYGDNVAVGGIDLTVRAGSFYGIVGPNGAGKTTTLSMATGLLRPDEGTVQILGLDVWKKPRESKRAIGVLPDRLRLFDRLTGAQLLYYSGMLRGLDDETVRARTADLAAAFGLDDALDRLVSDYSAGMTKKVALAAAMIHAPRLLVLDEPFESVDPVSAATVTDILHKFVSAGGTVVMSSHSMDLIERVCDGVAIIIKGRVLASGTIDEVRGSGTLEERFVELAGGSDATEGLEWLHSFSD